MNALPDDDLIAASKELRRAALRWLAESDPYAKSDGVAMVRAIYFNGEMSLDEHATLSLEKPIPGRPDQPELVPPRDVARRSVHTAEGRAAMIHALAHIEFNAVNLALDAVWRFQGMPREYYEDWLTVASEEAMHFDLLSSHLRKMGFRYGDFAAHNGLWDMAEKTSHDVLARMALVPRTLEARGLDASPAMRDKLAAAGDTEAAGILEIILRDEIGHVAVGNRWFNHLCAGRGIEPVETYAQLAKEHGAPALRGPFNIEARKAAGFSEAEIAALPD